MMAAGAYQLMELLQLRLKTCPCKENVICVPPSLENERQVRNAKMIKDGFLFKQSTVQRAETGGHFDSHTSARYLEVKVRMEEKKIRCEDNFYLLYNADGAGDAVGVLV